MKTHIKVRFQGRELWWLKDDDTSCGPLAPLDHCDEKGDVIAGALLEDSFAHVCDDGKIRRYHSVIGSVDDLELQHAKG